jgi:hypothetical protein
MFDLAQTPIVLIGPKNVPAMMIAAGLMATVTGIVVWSISHIALIGGITVLVGLWVLVVGIAIRKMGFRLTVSPEGLDYVNLGGKRFWRWRDVDSFNLVHFKTAWVIGFREYTKDPRGKHFYLPSRWDRPMQEVVELLTAAQAKWGTGS